MSWWRRPKKGWSFATDDVEVVSHTESSDELAHRVLDEARQKSRGKAKGSEVTVTVRGDHSHIHHLEFMLSLMHLSGEYGLQVVVQHDNAHTFRVL